jgi:hypothetical protein
MHRWSPCLTPWFDDVVDSADFFRRRNPFFEGSARALMARMEENAQQNPGQVLVVKRAIAGAGDVMS